MLEFKGLKKSFDQSEIIKGIDLCLATGHFHAIIGPSGAGKTTLLRLIGGLIQPDQGEILLHGSRLSQGYDPLVPGFEEVKIVHQDYQLKANMTVRENLNYALIGYEPTYKIQRIEQLLSICRLQNLADRDASQLSGGQKQRVSIARALATEPEVILMDEPFSNLDPMTKNVLLQESRQIANDTNTTIVLVTHDTRDALEVADQIHVLINGRIVQSDTPTGLYQKPEKPEIANLLGYMNFISSNDQLVGYWAEDVNIDGGPYTGIIEHQIYKGPYQLIKIKSRDFEHHLLAYDYSRTFQTGDSVQFSLNESNKTHFGALKTWERWLLDL